MGFKKDQNKEYILQICHNPVSNKCSKNITHSYGATFATTLGGGIPLKWMLMVPCTTDGLPYFYSKDYKGFNKINDIYDNRDYRLTSTVMVPGQTYYIMGVQVADKNTYSKADYVTSFDFPEGCTVYYPTVTATGATSFMNRKMCSERKNYGDGDESYNYPVLRLAEMYLIYAEAKCELGNGSISDADLNKSINVLHRRGGLAPISNASIAAANANYAANTGKSGKLTMMELIQANMTRKNYLYPIPLAQIQLNPALLQNLGY